MTSSLHNTNTSLQNIPWYCDGTKVLINFFAMSLCFSINHATVTTVLALSFSSDVLTADEAKTSNSLLYVFYTLAALTIASGLVQSFGSKTALFAGLSLYCFYVASYLVAFFVDYGTLRWFLVVIGSVIGGFAAGWLWTAQGSFFARTCQLYNDATGADPKQTTARLGGAFAFVYVGFEVILKALGTLIVPSDCSVHCDQKRNLYFVLTGCACISALIMLFVRELPSEDADSEGNQPKSKTQIFSVRKIMLAGKLLVDSPKMMCLAPLNVTFGLMSALINTYLNAAILNAAIGKDNKYSYLMISSLPFTACVLSLPFGFLARFVGKCFLMVSGAVCYVIMCAWFLAYDLEQWSKLGYGVIAVYILAGVGRAIFEGTNKAVFADFFPNDKEAAFSNIIVQSGLSAAIAFFVFPSLDGETGDKIKSGICLPFAIITCGCLFLAFRFHKKSMEHRPLLSDVA